MNTQVEAIGFVQAVRLHAEDDFWGGEEACITLAEGFTAEALQGLSEFSHVEVLFLFHEVEPSKVVTGARHPRNNPACPAVGIDLPPSTMPIKRMKSWVARLNDFLCGGVGSGMASMLAIPLGK